MLKNSKYASVLIIAPVILSMIGCTPAAAGGGFSAVTNPDGTVTTKIDDSKMGPKPSKPTRPGFSSVKNPDGTVTTTIDDSGMGPKRSAQSKSKKDRR